MRARHRSRRYFRGPLHRRIFVWFGLSILMTGIAVAIGWRIVRPYESFGPEVDGARRFLAGQLARAWHDPHERDEVAAAISRELGLGVRLEDGNRRELATFGGPCRGGALTTPIQEGGETLGSVVMCFQEHPGRARYVFFPLLIGMVVLWGA